MNWNQVQGNWKQFKGKIQAKWGDLTDDELDVINGRREELVGKIQESYGIAREEAEQQVQDFERTL
ncbi:MAG: CsbD family protein [Gammaproteobacteria bacterium]|nr:CsbD family protein [Gammaproteobacteria bacterium]